MDLNILVSSVVTLKLDLASHHTLCTVKKTITNSTMLYNNTHNQYCHTQNVIMNFLDQV